MPNPTFPHIVSADTLVRTLHGVVTWPQMAIQFARAIETIKAHERLRVVMLEQLAERDKKIAALRDEIDELVLKLGMDPIEKPAA